MVVITGATVTEFPFKEPGIQVKFVPEILLLAVSFEESPKQIAGGVAEGMITGLDKTLTVTVSVPEHPNEVPVKV